ncbi:MAG TPA: class I SAM-dependent methyltransferase [Thermoanaerobaculia bacterium]|nr:class I SAM-dependent methyltransferase [Thermoanaerobaculia bacterium]
MPEEADLRKRRQWAAFRDAEAYESRIGRFALAVDGDAVLELLAAAGLGPGTPVLDLPSGAGRMTALLERERSVRVMAADYNLDMVRVARRRTASPGVRCDAFAAPFRDGSFGAVVTLRLAFHYTDLSGLAAEIGRILRPGGIWLFDTLNRGSLRHAGEPLAVLAGRRRSGGLRFTAPAAVAAELERQGFEVLASRSTYLMPTRLYRFLPGPLLRLATAIERRVPPQRRVLTFWSARRRS